METDLDVILNDDRNSRIPFYDNTFYRIQIL